MSRENSYDVRFEETHANTREILYQKSDTEKIVSFGIGCFQVPSKVHMCSLCGRKFARRYDMKRHEERHDKEKKFVCQVCGEAFDRKYKLFEHRKANHIKRRPRKQKPKAAEDSGKITKLKLHTN